MKGVRAETSFDMLRVSAAFPRAAARCVRHAAPYTGSLSSVTPVREVSTFRDIGIVDDGMLAQLRRAGVDAPSAIQEQAIPPLLDGRHTVITAETGSGKTLAYLLPLLQRLEQTRQRDGAVPATPRGVVVVPTQELVLQVADVARRVCPHLHDAVQVAYGRVGPPRSAEYACLVSTPVALRDNVRGRHLEDVATLVLDEADMLLSGSLASTVLDSVVSPLQARAGHQAVQMVFCAATLPHRGPKSVKALIDRRFPDTATASTDGVHKPVQSVQQTFLCADDVDVVREGGDAGGGVAGLQLVREGPPPGTAAAADDAAQGWKRRALVEALVSTADDGVGTAREAWGDVTVARRAADRQTFAASMRPEEAAAMRPTLVFVSSVQRAKDIAAFITDAARGNAAVGVLHKKQGQRQRQETLRQLEAGEVRVVVCTDVAARGLDTVAVEHGACCGW